MKKEYIIDEATGELIETKNNNELVEKKLFEVGAIDKETFELIETFKYYEEQYKTFKYKLKKAMKENDIKKWDNDLFIAYITPEGMQRRVDVERLKKDGIYDKYSKFIPVDEKITIKFKENK